MPLGDYLTGVILVALVAAPIAIAATALERRLWPAAGALGVLARFVVGLSMVMVAAAVVGSVGAFSTGAVVAACVGLSLVAYAAARRRRPSSADVPPREPRASLAAGGGVATVVVVVVVIAAVVAQWLSGTARAFDAGVHNVDSLWYHLPYAARFVQESSIWQIPFVQADPLLSADPGAESLFDPSGVASFHPANASLFHALGILFFDRDVASPLLNAGWLALTLLAGWCVGLPYRVPAATLCVTAVVTSAPLLSESQPGEALSDVVGLFFLTAALALLVNARGARAPMVLAGLAAGAALGTKLTFVVPVVALIVPVVVAAPVGRRASFAATWMAGVLTTGAVWYVRNWAETGSPLPLMKLQIGPLSLPSADLPSLRRNDQAVADYLFDGHAWDRYFVPGLEAGLGPLWPLILALALAGVAVAVVRGDSLQRALGAAGALAFVGYLLTPQTAGGPEGEPGLFVFNLRFMVPALMIGGVLLATTRPLRGSLVAPAFVGTATVVTLFNVVDSNVWAGQTRTLALLALAASLVLLLPRLGARSALTLGLIALAAGLPLARHYLDHRYTGAGGGLDAVYRWAQGIEDARIGYAGFIEHYPLYGRDISNRVEYIGRRGAHGAFKPPSSCDEWAAAVTRGRYDYVVITAHNYPYNPTAPKPAAVSWARDDPAASQILRPDRSVWVFRTNAHPAMSSRACEAAR